MFMCNCGCDSKRNEKITVCRICSAKNVTADSETGMCVSCAKKQAEQQKVEDETEKQLETAYEENFSKCGCHP